MVVIIWKMFFFLLQLTIIIKKKFTNWHDSLRVIHYIYILLKNINGHMIIYIILIIFTNWRDVSHQLSTAKMWHNTPFFFSEKYKTPPSL
jgi:hypothetical protein